MGESSSILIMYFTLLNISRGRNIISAMTHRDITPIVVISLKNPKGIKSSHIYFLKMKVDNYSFPKVTTLVFTLKLERLLCKGSL